MVKHLQPELGAVVWDEGLPQKRVELQPLTRNAQKCPTDGPAASLSKAYRFRNISLPDTEADDLMGCYAIAAQTIRMDVVLATNDKRFVSARVLRESLYNRESGSRVA
jgi:DNA polymerase-1